MNRGRIVLASVAGFVVIWLSAYALIVAAMARGT